MEEDHQKFLKYSENLTMIVNDDGDDGDDGQWINIKLLYDNNTILN